MTRSLTPEEAGRKLAQQVPGSVQSTDGGAILIDRAHLLGAMTYLKETPGLDFDYLADLTGTDFYDYFEVVYHLLSLKNNLSLTVKTRVNERGNPSLDSVTGLWRGADYQEREIYDLMGIAFQGHPNLKRIFLWEGFVGYPLRKEYL
jgi:NADH-quinone oxidoreductase subunit C